MKNPSRFDHKGQKQSEVTYARPTKDTLSRVTYQENGIVRLWPQVLPKMGALTRFMDAYGTNALCQSLTTELRNIDPAPIHPPNGSQMNPLKLQIWLCSSNSVRHINSYNA